MNFIAQNDRQPTAEDLPADVWGRVLNQCGPGSLAKLRAWAALGQCSRAMRAVMSAACLDVAELDLGGDEVRRGWATDARLGGIGRHYRQLATLKLRCTSVTNAGLGHVGMLGNLTSLDLSRCDGITDGGLGHVGMVTYLTGPGRSLVPESGTRT